MTSSREILLLIGREVGRCVEAVDSHQLDAVVEAIDGVPRVFLAGAGRSGLAMRACAMRLMHLGKAVHVVGDVTTPGIAKGDILLIGLGSGSTESLCGMASRAKGMGARVILLTIVPDSAIGQIANVVLRIPAPSPKAEGAGQTIDSRQPMRSLFEQTLFVVGDAIVLTLMGRRGLTSEEMFARHANLE